MTAPTLADRIDALLPQTQCQRCGYAACRPYAEALADGKADINQCPPGGSATIAAIAQLLGVATKPVDVNRGVEQPLRVAEIVEDQCIGCTKCIQACPVDAILGAAKRTHTVLTDLCSGCELCLQPCPVDCIVMRPAPFEWDNARASAARQRYVSRQGRLSVAQRKSRAEAPEPESRTAPALSKSALQAQIKAAVARTRAKRRDIE